MNPRIRVDSATGQAAMEAVLLIGPYDLENMILLDVLVPHRDAMGAFSMPYPTGESQHRPQEFFLIYFLEFYLFI